jgi:hypothetical protein
MLVFLFLETKPQNGKQEPLFMLLKVGGKDEDEEVRASASEEELDDWEVKARGSGVGYVMAGALVDMAENDPAVAQRLANRPKQAAFVVFVRMCVFKFYTIYFVADIL